MSKPPPKAALKRVPVKLKLDAFLINDGQFPEVQEIFDSKRLIATPASACPNGFKRRVEALSLYLYAAENVVSGIPDVGSVRICAVAIGQRNIKAVFIIGG